MKPAVSLKARLNALEAKYEATADLCLAMAAELDAIQTLISRLLESYEHEDDGLFVEGPRGNYSGKSDPYASPWGGR